MNPQDPPYVVGRDIRTAIESAVQFGVSAKDFMAIVADQWSEVLLEKRRRDVAELMEGVATDE